MLGKLIKYEWKSTYKVGCLLLAILAAVSFLGWLALGPRPSVWESYGRRAEASEQAGAVLQSIFTVFSLMLYVMMLVGVNYGILIYLGVHFYKTMYTREGYLLHTLPVTKHEILCSKILVGGLWMMILTVSVYISVFIFGLTVVDLFLPSGYTLSDLWRDGMSGISEVILEMEDMFGWNFASWLGSMLVMLLVGPFSSIMILFGAISTGQLFTKARAFMAIMCYFGIWVIGMLISSVIKNVFGTAFSFSFGRYINSSSYVGIVVNALIAVGLYFVSYYVTSSKLNME